MGGGELRHSLSLSSSPRPPAAPKPQQPASGERAPKVSPSAARARGGPRAGCAELRSVGRALPRALGWDTPWVFRSAWPRGSGDRVGASRRTWQKRTPRGSRSSSFSVGAVFPTRLWAGRRGQLRGVCVCERPQRRGRDGPAGRRWRGTSRTGQAGKRLGSGRGRTTASLAGLGNMPRVVPLYHWEMQKAWLR